MAKDKQIKLTDKQKQIIRLMRDGQEFTLTGLFGVTVSWREQMELLLLGITESSKKNQFIYELTELGKSIEL